MNRIVLAYILLRYRTWIRAGWQLGRHEHHRDVFWAHRAPRAGQRHLARRVLLGRARLARWPSAGHG